MKDIQNRLNEIKATKTALEQEEMDLRIQIPDVPNEEGKSSKKTKTKYELPFEIECIMKSDKFKYNDGYREFLAKTFLEKVNTHYNIGNIKAKPIKKIKLNATQLMEVKKLIIHLIGVYLRYDDISPLVASICSKKRLESLYSYMNRGEQNGIPSLKFNPPSALIEWLDGIEDTGEEV